jgi:ribose transport system permease protein
MATPDRTQETGLPAVSIEESSGVARSGWHRVAELQQRYPLVQLIALAALFLYGAQSLEGFTSSSSVKSMLILASLVGLAALGQTFVVLIGGFDLSVPGFIVGAAIVVSQLTEKYGITFGEALILCIIGAGLLGGLVGWLCHRFLIQPLIATLAMGSIVVGLMQVQTGGVVSGSTPVWLSKLVSPIGKTFGIGVPPVLFIWLAVAVVVAVVLHRMSVGRKVYATGANPLAADFSLIRTRRVWIGVFAFSAIASAMVGVLLAGFAGTVNTTLGNPYLLQGLAAVIVGGTVFGGPGDYSRTVIGALLLTVLTTVLIGHGFDQADEQILYGVIILVAVSLYGRERRVRDSV